MSEIKEVRSAELDTVSVIEGGLLKYKGLLKVILQNALENLFGGPREWPTGINPRDEDSEEQLVSVWNDAIDKAIEKVKLL